MMTIKTGEKNSRRSYSDYVNHMIRFFLSTPEGLTVTGHTGADVNNWVAVQTIWSDLSAEEQALIRMLYTSGRPYEETVYGYATEHGLSVQTVWKIITNVTTRIAKVRGLI